MCSRVYANSKAILCGDSVTAVVPKKILGVIGLVATSGALLHDGVGLFRLLVIHGDSSENEKYLHRQASNIPNGILDIPYWLERLTRSTCTEVVCLLVGKLLPPIQGVLVLGLQASPLDSMSDQGSNTTSHLVAKLGSYPTASLVILLLFAGLSNYCSFSLVGGPIGGFKSCVVVSCWMSLSIACMYFSCAGISVGEMLGASLPFAMSVGASYGLVFDRISEVYQQSRRTYPFVDEEYFTESQASLL